MLCMHSFSVSVVLLLLMHIFSSLPSVFMMAWYMILLCWQLMFKGYLCFILDLIDIVDLLVIFLFLLSISCYLCNHHKTNWDTALIKCICFYILYLLNLFIKDYVAFSIIKTDISKRSYH